MRVVFFGTAAFAVSGLERLVAERQDVVLCVTQPDRPRGRGLLREPSPVKQAAERLGLPLLQPERPEASALVPLKPDIGVVAAYGELIRRELLAVPVHGMLGVHPSLLPKYRGAAPVAWTLLNGDPRTGVTIFRMNERLDAGEVVLQEETSVEPGETAETLTARLAVRGADLLVRALGDVAAGRARFVAQDESQATLAPKLSKAQGRIEWTAPAQAIERLARAAVPWPGAFVAWPGGPLKIWQASVGAGPAAAPPGTVVRVNPEAITVAAGQGVVDIAEVQPAGRRRMSVREFLAGHPVREGDVFGAASHPS